jgi:hypothetical protein
MKKKTLVLILLLTSSIVNSQIIFSENFENGNLSGWTNLDNDSDNTVTGIDYDHWYSSTAYEELVNGADGMAAVSHSQAYANGTWSAFQPNNFLISPSIDLTNEPLTNINLKFETGSGQVTGGHAEHYAVYVTTSTDISAIEAAIPVFEETLPSGETMFSHVVDISQYSGQVVYVAIRHFDCTNQFNLLVDNIIVEHILTNNATISDLSLNRYSLTNTNNDLGIYVVNDGANVINSLEVDWNDGTPHTTTISGLNIAPFTTYLVMHPEFINYTSVTEKNLNVSIIQVNGAVDSDLSGNTAQIKFNTISEHSDKFVVFEEGTGTWCPSCPAGTVMMETMTEEHTTDLIGIAVHVGTDPMTLAEYEVGSNFVAAPTIHVDRKILNQNVDNANVLFNSVKTKEVPVALNSTISVSGQEVQIVANATFKTNFAASNFRLGVIITEDDVQGNDSGYNQANIFAGGDYGDMGEFDELPNPVPASQMVYQHVGRALLGGYDGQENSIPSQLSDGQEVMYNFNYTIPSGSDKNKMHVVLVLIDQETGEIVNANSNRMSIAGINELSLTKTTIAPNPTRDFLNISFNGNGNSYVISICDNNGRIIKTKEVGVITGMHEVYFEVGDLKSGDYLINISSDFESTTKHFIKY